MPWVWCWRTAVCPGSSGHAGRNLKLGMVPDLRGLMREDAISVLVQRTPKPELPDTRAGAQESRTSGSSRSIVAVWVPQDTHPQKRTRPAMSSPPNQVIEASG
jgi:hypothetical protein